MANLRDIDTISTGNSATTQIDLTGNQVRLLTASTERIRVDNTGLTVQNAQLFVVRSGVNNPANLTLRADAGNNRMVLFNTGANARWSINVGTGSESGSNAGSDFAVGRYADSGTLIDNVVTITRSTGVVTLPLGLVVGGYSVLSINSTVAAAGSTQGAATALTRTINVVTSSTAGTAIGVALPASPVAGTVITVINASANAINVYPASGGTIDALAANAAFPLGSQGKLQFVASSTTQWYALTAVYG